MEVLWTEEFKKEMRKKCSKVEQQKIINFSHRLREQENLGAVLGPRNLKEFRLNGKRIYFVINKDAYLVAVSDKKNQQEVIEKLRASLPERV